MSGRNRQLDGYEHYETFKFERQGEVLLVKFSCPEQLNVVTAKLHTELGSLFADIARDHLTKAIVLTGEGPAFSAGGDLNWFDHITIEETDLLFTEARKIIIDILELPQPIIAAINGPAVGLGATLALFCDVIFASENARILDPHVLIGLTAGDGGAIIWPWLIGPARAKQYLMTGDPVSAREAERIGLINEVVPSEQLMEVAVGFADRLTKGNQRAIRSTKWSVNKLLRDSANMILDTSLALEKECFASAEHKQAVRKFLGK